MLFGFLNIYKPKGITSHDVVAKIRRAGGIRQIGHSGTLDPMAEGVLPVAVGKAARLIEFLDEGKTYIAQMEFGKVSDTYDIEGALKEYSSKKVLKEEVLNGLQQFSGKIEQIPPAYSAVHYKGKRLYELARQGIVPDDIPKRTVFVNKIELLDFDFEKQTAKIEIDCSKGTYIRSIVHDLGLALGSGAVMTTLIRTRCGKFRFADAVPVDAFVDKSDVESNLINPVDVLSYNCYNLSEFEFQKVKHGQPLKTKQFEEDEYICLVYQDELCAVAKKGGKDILVTKKVFVP